MHRIAHFVKKTLSINVLNEFVGREFCTSIVIGCTRNLRILKLSARVFALDDGPVVSPSTRRSEMKYFRRPNGGRRVPSLAHRDALNSCCGGGDDTQRIVVAAHANMLRNPWHGQIRGQYWKDQKVSAPATVEEVNVLPSLWHFGGDAVLTFENEELDMERFDANDEDPFIYSMRGEMVFVDKVCGKDGRFLIERSTPLLNPYVSWGKDSRRTMNHMFARADSPNVRSARSQQLSYLFWMDVSKRIQEAGDEDFL